MSDYDWFEDDITYCTTECGYKECYRNPINIRNHNHPHSFALLGGTDYCPLAYREKEEEERKR